MSAVARGLRASTRSMCTARPALAHARTSPRGQPFRAPEAAPSLGSLGPCGDQRDSLARHRMPALRRLGGAGEAGTTQRRSRGRRCRWPGPPPCFRARRPGAAGSSAWVCRGHTGRCWLSSRGCGRSPRCHQGQVGGSSELGEQGCRAPPVASRCRHCAGPYLLVLAGTATEVTLGSHLAGRVGVSRGLRGR